MNQASTQPAIGFIGLGIMGFSMASRLAAAGYPLNVYNRTRAKAEPLIEAGAHWHATPQALAAVSDVIFTIVGTFCFDSNRPSSVCWITTYKPFISRRS